MSPARATAVLRRRVRELPDEEPTFQIAPMIDVLLILLMFFLSIGSTEMLQSARGLALPVAVAGGNDPAGNQGQIVVNVLWTGDRGSLIVDERSYAAPAELIPLLKEHVVLNPNTRVLIRADKNARYSYVREVLLAVSRSKVSNVTFSLVGQAGPPP